MKLIIKAGATSRLVRFFVNDSSVTTGAGLTGLTNGSGSLTAYYVREGANAAVSISLSSGTLGTWSSGGFIVVDGTNMPGLYELGLPDAAVAASAKSVVVMLKGVSNMAPVLLEIQLVSYDSEDSVRLGLTALPNAAAGANGGLPTGDGSGRVTVITNSDKTGYALTAGEHTNIATDTQTGLTAQGYTTTRAGYLDTLSGLVAAIWATAVSDLTGVPTSTTSVLTAINWLFMLGRNKRIQTSTTETIYKNDGSTSVATSVKSDDGTTFTRAKYT